MKERKKRNVLDEIKLHSCRISTICNIAIFTINFIFYYFQRTCEYNYYITGQCQMLCLFLILRHDECDFLNFIYDNGKLLIKRFFVVDFFATNQQEINEQFFIYFVMMSKKNYFGKNATFYGLKINIQARMKSKIHSFLFTFLPFSSDNQH